MGTLRPKYLLYGYMEPLGQCMIFTVLIHVRGFSTASTAWTCRMGCIGLGFRV